MKPPLRTKSVGTKVSEAEFAALEARAQASGRTLSEWVRDVLLSAPGTGRPGNEGTGGEAMGAPDNWAGEVVLAEVLALRTLFLNLRPLPDHDLPSAGEVRAEIARVDATKMQRARERLAAQKKADEAGR
ncbi:MAG: plasmid mobilization protein [Acidobacteriaceae bacterium]